MPNGEAPRLRYKYVAGLGGMTLNGEAAPIMIIGSDKGRKLGRIIPPGTLGRLGKPVAQLVTPPNLKNILDSYAAENVHIPPEIYQAINMAIQASH